jgi:hypothetical protein
MASFRPESHIEDLEPGDDEIHPNEDLYFDIDNAGDQHRGGIHGRTDRCRGILDALSMEEIARRIENIIQEMRKVDFDLATLVFWITMLQGHTADTPSIRLDIFLLILELSLF